MELAGKNITVVGLARSGAGSARLLADMGASVTVTDRKTAGELADIVKVLPSSVRLCLGSHPEGIFLGADLIVVSPGVPLDIRQLELARTAGKRIIGELELAYRIMETRWTKTFPIPFFAITGSNGKSTTTSLLNHMMTKSGFRTVFGGNIGNALTEEVIKLNEEQRSVGEEFRPPDAVVAEISSFQLEAIECFQPHIAAVLNITPDHLDRYHSMEEYAEAKAGIFRNQQPLDLLVLNRDDSETMKLYESRLRQNPHCPQVFFFSRLQEVEGVYLKDGMVRVNLPHLEQGQLDIDLITTDAVRIRGVHNLENAMAASAMALLANCPVDAVRASLMEFPGLEHRLEEVRELEGIRYINDSKGTNVGAVIKSIESFDQPVVLIAGGRDKAGDFSELRKPVAKNVKAVVLIGEAAPKIRRALGDLTETVMASDLADAVNKARGLAGQGCVVLLSPACASFDMFLDFEDRGRQFKKIVAGLGAAHA